MKTILVVDDEPTILESMELVLEIEQYTVVTASNGKEALERIAESRPDLVLSDVMMPVMDGLELLRAIKTDPALAGIPVVIMSAGRPDPAMVDPPWDRFLPKPARLDVLLSVLKDLLEGSSGASP